MLQVHANQRINKLKAHKNNYTINKTGCNAGLPRAGSIVLNNYTVNLILRKVRLAPKQYFTNPNNVYFDSTNNFEIEFDQTSYFMFVKSPKTPYASGYINVQVHNYTEAACKISNKHKRYMLAQLQLIYNNIVW